MSRADARGRLLRTAAIAATVSSIGLGVRDARAGRPDFPCRGCFLESAARATGPVPLLVLLHGDGQRAIEVVAPFSKPAVERGIALVALACPRELGCRTASFWQWNGDPAWLDARVRDVADATPIDADRTWIAGWSGGASYLGDHAPSLGGRFAAAVFLGGGMAPPVGARCPAPALPVRFLVGDANPLHGLAVALRGYFDGCGGEVVWDLRRGVDHSGEHRALVAPGAAAAILDWLAAHSRAREEPKPAPDIESAAPSSAPEPHAEPTAKAVSEPTGVLRTPLASATHCAPCGACELRAAEPSAVPLAAIVAVLLVSRRAGGAKRKGRASRRE